MLKRKPSKKRIVVCYKCNKQFPTRHSQGKYCSPECGREGERDSWNKYGNKNREKRNEYWKDYYKKNREEIIKRTTEYGKTERGKIAVKKSYQNQKEKYPEKIKAREEVIKAIRKGILKKGLCEECGIQKVDAHHDDYSKPLDVRWFCHKHHRILEGRYIEDGELKK